MFKKLLLTTLLANFAFCAQSANVTAVGKVFSNGLKLDEIIIKYDAPLDDKSAISCDFKVSDENGERAIKDMKVANDSVILTLKELSLVDSSVAPIINEFRQEISRATALA
ncbi:hypothetical protein [Campylobacter gastrosuis]|uniref:Esterase Ig-like N-terminal domain-containing protein n=1 Tax=Campylobacter gastrosuis TaxID=2974576 RepID=A0ABT7HQL6_9BACT|nr:hypothetical protein [Campylobacter gastrosuis]MDL0088718.1 hypothetical protein [Campylobacter gastrosuis]